VIKLFLTGLVEAFGLVGKKCRLHTDIPPKGYDIHPWIWINNPHIIEYCTNSKLGMLGNTCTTGHYIQQHIDCYGLPVPSIINHIYI